MDVSAADRARAAVLQALAEVAPEADLANLRGDAVLRQTFDIDSMDFLRMVVRLEELLRCRVPETDYAQLATLDSASAYLAARPPAGP